MTTPTAEVTWPKIGHGAHAKVTLGTLDEEVVLLQLGEDEVEVFRPRRAVYKDVIEEDEDEPVEEGAQHFVHQDLEGHG
jgi:hypothetical protein